MKTILVDAVNTFISKEGKINQEIFELLEQYPNPKIIVTNADEQQIIQFGLVNLPYPLFSLQHNPEKTDPAYFKKILQYFDLNESEVIYFEHNLEAIKSAESIGIVCHHYDPRNKDLDSLKRFLEKNNKS